MKLVGVFVSGVAFAVIFWRWYQAEGRPGAPRAMSEPRAASTPSR